MAPLKDEDRSSYKQNTETSINITGGVGNSVVVAGDRNTIYYTDVTSSLKTEPFRAKTAPHRTPEEIRYREILISKMCYYWIDGVLKRSLHNQALIELGLEKKNNAVNVQDKKRIAA